ncbi:MAG: hypothetical protein N3B16_08485 [Candidatus Aminicenantes bacterium]|nr:hypothetical protein [Candidatus Aminicenantes bacterium]
MRIEKSLQIISSFHEESIVLFSLLIIFIFPLPSATTTLASLYLEIEETETLAVEIFLKAESSSAYLIGRPDSKGHLSFLGLSPGNYELLLKFSEKKQWREKITLEPSQSLHLKIKWLNNEIRPRVDRYDLSDLGAQTVINWKQISLLPSADNFTSVIENQDLSATTNRIDSGGLWADYSALFSSRGGTSWTQNEFRLNGLNITEPYFGGTPLILPDLMTLEVFRHRHGLHPPSVASPGGLIELFTKKGGHNFQFGSLFGLIEPWLTTSNITPSLREEGLTESHKFNHDRKLRLWASGPLGSKNLPFFLSLVTQEIDRDVADYNGHNRTRFLSGTLRITQNYPSGEISFFLARQQTTEEEAGARRNIPREATLKAHRNSYLGQLFWQSRPSSKQAFFGGLSLAYQNLSTFPYVSEQTIPCREIFRPLVWKAPLNYGQEKKAHLNFNFQGELLLGTPSSSYHLLRFGQDFSYRIVQATHKIPNRIHLLFLEGRPRLINIFSPEIEETEKASDWSFFFQDFWHLTSYFIFEAGFQLLISKGTGGSPKSKRTFGDVTQTSPVNLNWINLLPRFSLTLPLSQGRKGFFKIFYGQTTHLLLLNYLRWGNPEAEGSLIYQWEDWDNDAQLDHGEISQLLRRDGPFFARLDPKIKRPKTSEFSISFVYRLSQEFFLSLSGFTRLTHNLIETENIGVVERDYEKLTLEDIGDDQIPGTHDDCLFIIYNRLPHALGKDFFWLTNPDSAHRTSRYRGLDLFIVRRFSDQSFYFSFTATEAYGTTSPGNTEWENDDALIGWLYDDPNSLINARGRLRFDRAYTARLGFSLNLPSEIKAGFIIKYYDGQPFTRKIIIDNLNQGPIFIQAFPRGIARYEFNMTVDFRLEKSFIFSVFRSSFFIEGYNLFNQHLATQENEWTSPEFPLRLPTEIQPPRVFRLGIKFEF